MTIQELINDTQFVLKEGIDVLHFINLCNECLAEDLIDILRLETKATITLAEDDLAVSFPTDIYEVIALKADGTDDDAPVAIEEVSITDEDSAGYRQFDKTIELVNMTGDPYSLTLWYYRYPATITAITDTPDIPSQFRSRCPTGW